MMDCKIQLLSTSEGNVLLIATAGSDNNVHLFHVQYEMVNLIMSIS
jgi:ABC-type xylose transport system substrate-binding protein